MPAVTKDWTVDMLTALPDDGNRYEIIDGELFVTPSPSPPHQRAVRYLLVELHLYLREHGFRAEAMPSPLDARVADRTSVEPDVLVMPHPLEMRTDGFPDLRALLLAIEIVSPSSARTDRTVKRLLYQRSGVEYWIVDLDSEIVERWLPADERPEILRDVITWSPASASTPLTIRLPALFAEVRGG